MVDEEAKKVGEIIDVVAARLPAVLATFKETFLSESAARDFGKAVGAFYKELLASGIPSDEATTMAIEYMDTIKGAFNFNQAQQSGGRQMVWCGPCGGEPGHEARGGEHETRDDGR